MIGEDQHVARELYPYTKILSYDSLILCLLLCYKLGKKKVKKKKKWNLCIDVSFTVRSITCLNFHCMPNSCAFKGFEMCLWHWNVRHSVRRQARQRETEEIERLAHHVPVQTWPHLKTSWTPQPAASVQSPKWKCCSEPLAWVKSELSLGNQCVLV